MQSVQRVIESMQPRYIVSMDDDYMKYMSPSVQKTYGSKFITVYKASTVQDNPTCAMIERIMSRGYLYDNPIYIVRDENSFHAEDARALTACLRDRGHEVDLNRAGTLSDLKRVLLELQSKPKGLLISLVGTVFDPEFNQTLDQDRINDYIVASNKRHVDISLVRGNRNLSIVFIPRIVGAKISGDQIQIDQVIPQLYVDPDRLKDLGASIVYKNMFEDIAGVITD